MPSETVSTCTEEVAEGLEKLERNRRKEQARRYARSPKRIDKIIAQVMLRSGYGRMQANEQLTQAWQEAAGDRLAGHTRVGTISRGRLQVLVANSTIRQELDYAKTNILAKLKKSISEPKIRDIRFRVGKID